MYPLVRELAVCPCRADVSGVEFDEATLLPAVGGHIVSHCA